MFFLVFLTKIITIIMIIINKWRPNLHHRRKNYILPNINILRKVLIKAKLTLNFPSLIIIYIHCLLIEEPDEFDKLNCIYSEPCDICRFSTTILFYFVYIPHAPFCVRVFSVGTKVRWRKAPRVEIET